MVNTVLIIFLMFYGYNESVMYSNNKAIVLWGKVSNIDWQIESIVTKRGTNDPDELVPENQIMIIDTGDIIQGIIYLRDNKTILVKESNPQFYFSFYNQYQWDLNEENFIQFKRFGSDGRIIQSFGYNVRFLSDDKMQWFTKSVGIEDGNNSVNIITLYHK